MTTNTSQIHTRDSSHFSSQSREICRENEKDTEKERDRDGENPEESRLNVKGTKRSSAACERCHKSKTKCNGETPCRNCQQSRKPVECVYPYRDRKVSVSESYIKQLEAENRSLKRKRSDDENKGLQIQGNSCLQRTSNPLSGNQSPSHSVGKRPQYQSSPTHPSHPPHPSNENQENHTDVSLKFVTDEISIQPRYSGEASSETFGSRLHQYINHGETRPAPRPYIYYKHPKLFRISSTEYSLPNKNYAKLLVRAVLRFIGGDHHLLRRKSFLLRLEETYQLEVLDDPIWMCRLFTVLALGELYSSGRAGSAQPTIVDGPGVPGTDFFLKAMGFFQDMHEEPTIPYIETLLLLSFYCVALNRRNTAYTYAGLALRLGLTLGLHRKIPEDSGLSAPEREHRVRVWWTAYALDRIYTSKVGLPIMLRDSDIDVQMPSMDGLTAEEAEDFYSPELMNAHVKLARITGNVMSDLYKIPQPGKANTFVQSVQRILTGLREWHETLPEVLRLDFNSMPIYPSRPILFHVFRSRFDLKEPNPTPSANAISTSTSNAKIAGKENTTSSKAVSPMTAALADACVQAARTSNSILAQLWVDGCLAPFGYFDSLSVFASTMILMMSSAMKEDEKEEDDAVETAWSLLRSMREAGNLPANGYYDQLNELKNDLDNLRAPHYHPSLQPSNLTRNPSSPTPTHPFHPITNTTNLPPTIQNSPNTHSLGTSRLQHTAIGRHNYNIPSAFGVVDAMHLLSNPYLTDFLEQPYEWGDGMFDPVSGSPVLTSRDLGVRSGGLIGQEGLGGGANGGLENGFHFEWENANLF